MPLNLPNGSRCFIDANILVYQLINTPPFTTHVQSFLARVTNQELVAFTSSLILSEALHRIMLAEVLAVFQPSTKPLAHVQRHPQIIAQLPIYAVAVDRLLAVGIQLLPIDAKCLRAAGQIAAAHSLLTNDACIAAVMGLNNIRNLVTNDDDFDHIPGLTAWKPR